MLFESKRRISREMKRSRFSKVTLRTFDFPKGTFSHIIHASSETNPINAPLPSNLLFQANVKGTIKALELS